MTRLILAAGVAALAITAPAASAPGDGSGKDRRAQVQKARGGDARAQRSEQRANRSEIRSQRVETRRAGGERRLAAMQDRRPDRTERVRAERVQRADRVERAREQRVARVDRADNRRIERQQRAAERRLAPAVRPAERVAVRDRRELARIAEARAVPLRQWDELVRGGVWLDGCPPGLAKKPVTCMPPGQAQKLIGQPVSALSSQVALQALPTKLAAVYPDTADYYYRYGNGYMYQVNRNNDLVSALLPLFGLGLTAGQPFPTAYSNYYLPTGLQPFYPSSACGNYLYGDDDYYRYANGYVYEVDCRTGLVEDVDPLLGYGYGYGQMMPLTYSAYNVPYQYRSLYYDTPDYYYRYAPGAIYQVDPTTSLITAVAALLTGGLNVGQPLPLGYSAYNMPYQYRTTYYDTPDAWYRYSNGYVYRVDPATMLVTAVVASALT